MTPSKKKDADEPKRLPKLTVSRSEARAKIEARIREGETLLSIPINSKVELEKLSSNLQRWTDYNAEMLLGLFDTDNIRKEYEEYPGGFFSAHPTLLESISYYHDDIKMYLTRLKSIFDRIDLYEESNSRKMVEIFQKPKDNKRVFIVHGHDESLKLAVARILESLDLEPIILHEQPNQGNTIIEKFEKYSDVAFAIILLTGDDYGGSKNTDPKSETLRARQNVIFEFGFFIGMLGRKSVCAIYESGVEKPNDIDGLLYIPLDSSGSWKYHIAKELQSAGFNVDLNRIK